MLNYLKQLSEQILAPNQLVRKRYATFKELLAHDRHAHELLAQLENIHYAGKAFDINHLRLLFTEFSAVVAAMISCLQTLAPGQYRNLKDYHKKLDFYVRFAIAPPRIYSDPPWVLPIEAPYDSDLFTGGKGFHLSHLDHNLSLPIPKGFIISTSAWNRFILHNKLRPIINRELARVDCTSIASLNTVSQLLTEAVRKAEIPEEVERALVLAVDTLAQTSDTDCFAVRSSAVGEDSELSFAGQYQSVLNVHKKDIPAAWLQVIASKFTPEALLYRILNGVDDEAVPMAVIVLTMIDAKFSGVITTGNIDHDERHVYRAHVVSGLGDSLMSGTVSPVTFDILIDDRGFLLECPDLKEQGDLTDKLVQQLAQYARLIEQFYERPQEIEWCCNTNDELYLLQARRHNNTYDDTTEEQPVSIDLPLLFEGGETASSGIATGPVYALKSYDDLGSIPHGAILVCDVTPPSLVTILPVVSGVITRIGSVADHFSSVAREFSVPVLAKANLHPELIEEGSHLTLWADRCSIFTGLPSIPTPMPNKRQIPQSSPVGKALKMAIEFCSPLSLRDVGDVSFRPEGCRSLHDILRFAHEKSVQAMFLRNPDSFFRKPSSRKLTTEIPMQIFIIDVGDGALEQTTSKKEVSAAEIQSMPFHALWKGLTHQAINWQEHDHFDWKSYDNIALAGGIAGKEDTSFATYCLLSPEYLNINMRFGYHFALLDSLCTVTPEENYILLRFAGGGGTAEGQDLRLTFIANILARLNFDCEQTGELLDARLMRYGRETILDRLDQVGRLLGATRLLDMRLTQHDQIDSFVDAFFNEQYDYSST